MTGGAGGFGGLPEQSQREGCQSSAEEVAAFQMGKINHGVVLVREN